MYLFLFVGHIGHTACGTLVPRPGTKPAPPELKVQSLSHQGGPSRLSFNLHFSVSLCLSQCLSLLVPLCLSISVLLCISLFFPPSQNLN